MSDSAGIPSDEKEPKRRFQFRLKTLLLLPILVAVLVPAGIWVGCGALLVSTPILFGLVLVRSGKVSVVDSCVIVVALYVLIAMLLSATLLART